MGDSEVDDQALAGLYYADGPVRVYHGGFFLRGWRLCDVCASGDVTQRLATF